MTIRTKQK